MISKIRIGKTLVSASLASILGACAGGVDLHYHEGRPRPVVIQQERPAHVTHVTHVCDDHCDHYYDGPKVVVLRGHRHGPGCGHHVVEGRWMITARSRPARVERHPRAVHVESAPSKILVEHVHGPNCGCVFDTGRSVWITIERGHVHGPRCGHVHAQGRWIIRH